MLFPPEAYTQGDQFQREKATLFAREWLLFAAVAQLGEPGRYLSQTIGGWPVLAIRGVEGAIGAFRNACRHQQMPLVEKPEGQCGAQLRCRFHGWTYDLAGRFVSAPPLVAPADPAPERNSLHPVALHEAEGLLFIRLEESATVPSPIALEQRRFAGSVTTEVTANWKSAAEALLDTAAWRLEWPLGFVRDEAGARIVRQLVPRSFTRTRFLDLAFASGAAPPLEALQAAAAGDKQAAERQQAVLAARTADTPASPTVAAFRRRVAEATAAG